MIDMTTRLVVRDTSRHWRLRVLGFSNLVQDPRRLHDLASLSPRLPSNSARLIPSHFLSLFFSYVIIGLDAFRDLWLNANAARANRVVPRNMRVIILSGIVMPLAGHSRLNGIDRRDRGQNENEARPGSYRLNITESFIDPLAPKLRSR